MTELTSNAVRPLSVDADAKRLLHEYVSGWFDGESHTVPGSAATIFPRASVTVLPLGLENPPLPAAPTESTAPGLWLALGLVWGGGYSFRDGFSGTEHRKHAQMQWWIRTAGNTANHTLIQTGSDLLHAVLAHKNATLPLICKGVHSIRPRPVILVDVAQFQLRLLAATIEVAWHELDVIENP